MSNKILIIQFRTDQSRKHEQECFQKDFQREDLEYNFVNAVEDELTEDLVSEHKGVIFGGSTEYTLTQMERSEHQWLDLSNRLIGSAIEEGTPTLGICFGCHLLTDYLGGELSNHEQYHERGTYKVNLHPKSQQCEIFSNLSEEFGVQLGHSDTPIKLPEESEPLVVSDTAPYQAFRLSGKPVWGVLFHPELDHQRSKERLSMFLGEDHQSEEFKRKVSKIRETPHSVNVIHDFLDFCLQQN